MPPRPLRPAGPRIRALRITQTGLLRFTGHANTFENLRGWTAVMQKSDRFGSEGLDSTSRHAVERPELRDSGIPPRMGFPQNGS